MTNTFSQPHLWKLPDLAIVNKMILGPIKEGTYADSPFTGRNSLPKGLTHLFTVVEVLHFFWAALISKIEQI